MIGVFLVCRAGLILGQLSLQLLLLVLSWAIRLFLLTELFMYGTVKVKDKLVFGGGGVEGFFEALVFSVFVFAVFNPVREDLPGFEVAVGSKEFGFDLGFEVAGFDGVESALELFDLDVAFGLGVRVDADPEFVPVVFAVG